MLLLLGVLWVHQACKRRHCPCRLPTGPPKPMMTSLIGHACPMICALRPCSWPALHVENRRRWPSRGRTRRVAESSHLPRKHYCRCRRRPAASGSIVTGSSIFHHRWRHIPHRPMIHRHKSRPFVDRHQCCCERPPGLARLAAQRR